MASSRWCPDSGLHLDRLSLNASGSIGNGRRGGAGGTGTFGLGFAIEVGGGYDFNHEVSQQDDSQELRVIHCRKRVSAAVLGAIHVQQRFRIDLRSPGRSMQLRLLAKKDAAKQVKVFRLMIVDHYEVRFTRYDRGSFELSVRWQCPPNLPTVIVRVPPGFIRLFYPLYNAYVICGKHGPFRSYTGFWQSSAVKQAIAAQVDRCIGPFQEVATTYEVVGDLELTFNRRGAFLFVDGPMKIPPVRDSHKVKVLSEMLSATAGCFARSS